jgi:hypothetical protein
MPQSSLPAARFHIEHIVARQHGGTDAIENLALACDRCNAFKGTNLSAFDPESRSIMRLFDPRTQRWSEHFRQIGFQIVGLTPIGRATSILLNMNAQERVQLREELNLRLED